MRKLEDIVLETLQKSVPSREDDFVLINEVYKRLGIYTDLLNFDYLTKHHIELDLPSYESITRARRKIVEARPDLKSAAEIRKAEEKAYRDYYR
jgi:hypothetical protein